MTKQTGGPAFPYSALLPDKETRQLAGTMYADNTGMTLRDWFAGLELQGLLNGHMPLATDESFAEHAYKLSDAMLKAREE